MGLRDIFLNLKKRGATDILNPKKIKAYLQGFEIEKNGVHLSIEEIESFCEQIIYRRSMCPDCFSSSNCIHCGCKMPLSGYTPKNYCSGGNWGKMKSPEEWEEFKKEYNIKIGII